MMVGGRGILAHHKLRHLEGISLRKLTLSTSPKRPRRGTIDDDSLPNALSSPSKLSGQLAGLNFEHSKSAENLKQASEDQGSNGHAVVSKGDTSARPGKAGLRRRSTLSWVNESPTARQKRLEEAVVERRIDTFFSLHETASTMTSEPFYVSETKECSMNPDFQFFSVPIELGLARHETFVIRIWAKATTGDWVILLEMEVQLESLQFIGKTLDDCHFPMEDNSVVFHLADGVYVGSLNYQDHGTSDMTPTLSRTGTAITSKTSSYNALMQVKNLTDCIYDALQTRDSLTKQIEAIITENKVSGEKISAAVSMQASASNVKDAATQTQREVKKLKVQLQQAKAALEARRTAIATGCFTLQTDEESYPESQAVLPSLRTEQSRLKSHINGQIRRIATQLITIFPIEPIPHHPLCFTIAELYLPSAAQFSLASTSHGPPLSDETTAAALGFAAHITLLLANKLFLPLPYNIAYRGSTSTIFDPLTPSSQLGTSAKLPPNTTPTEENSPWRVYTLSQRGSADTRRFTWGVYLLNKCVEEVMGKVGIKCVDPRNTAANLKVLLSVLEGGRGDVPERKAGMVRGLSGLRTASTAPAGGLKGGEGDG